jgi:hypothetical protein
VTGPCHVLSPVGEWVDFEAFDPSAVDAVKALLDANIRSPDSPESGYSQALQEVVPALRQQPGTVASPTAEDQR